MNNLKLYLDRLVRWLKANPLMVALWISFGIMLLTIFWLDPLIGSLPAIVIMLALIAAAFIIASKWDEDPDDEIS